jgi:hypothetical protein
MMSETWMPGNKAELMAAIAREWKALMQVAENLTDEQMTTPDSGGWSPKDNLAHLAEWMKVLMGYHLDHRPPYEVLGVPPEVTKEWDFDVINPAIYQRNRDRTAEDVLSELRGTYAQLTAKLEAMSFEDLLKPRHADDPQKRPVLIWVTGDTTEHFLEHRETIERGVKASQS